MIESTKLRMTEASKNHGGNADIISATYDIPVARSQDIRRKVRNKII